MDNPLSDEMLRAIGNLITTWASAEGALAMQVGRLVAVEQDLEAGLSRIHPQAYLLATSVAMGTNAKAALGQIENLTFGHSEEIHKLALVILDIKGKRDRVAHCVPGARKGVTSFSGFGASRRRFGSDYPYSADQINEWAGELKKALLAIDTIVTRLTGFNWAAISQAVEEWSEFHHEAAQRALAQWNRPDNDPQAS